MDNVRNPDGIWINSSLFSEAGNHFMKYGYYCPDPHGSPTWIDYWREQRSRCLNGYSIGGVSITGDYYFYLNFCPIWKVESDKISKRKAKKVEGFPDFWDGDYNYYWVREIARNGIMSALNISDEEQEYVYALEDKKEQQKCLLKYYDRLQLFYKPNPNDLLGGLDLIIGKSRRKGFSFKNASIAACNYFHRSKSYTMFMAYEKKYLFPGNKTVFGKAQSYINFNNEHCGWYMPSDYINNQSHIKSSYKSTDSEGKIIEKGFLSEIECVSFKDNPDSGRGADAYDIFGEEVGAWGVPGGLKDTINAMRPSSEAGQYKTGMITLYGTSGDIEGGTADFAALFNSPEANGFMSFYDIYGKFESKLEGFFFPQQLNLEGFIDVNGNSDIEKAKEFENQKRDGLKAKGYTSSQMQMRMGEYPLNSAEAFALIGKSTFPVVELQQQRDKVVALGLQHKKGTPVKLQRKDGFVVAIPVLDGSIEPIISCTNIPVDHRGCPVIYEFPINNAPKGLYKIGYDPIRQDEGTSLAAIIVYKGSMLNSYNRDIIVAEYIGRHEDPDDIDRIAEMFADFYNTTIMYENECTGVKNYFKKIKRLNLLALQPDTVISKNIKVSKTSRVFGCHMPEPLKDAAERYVKTWLLQVHDYDENGNPITTIDKIYSLRLLEELIGYTRRGNFDLVSALFMAIIQHQENQNNVYGDKAIREHPVAHCLLSKLKKQ